jgi:membrane-bound ClpP family serine protease
MSPIFWSSILLLVGLSLVIAEIFVPSGGVIGFLAFSSIAAAIVMAFYNSGPLTGAIFLIIACGAVPLALAAAFRFLPDTPMGRRLLPTIPTAEEVLPDNEERRRLRQLIGRVGLVKSKMLPSGAVQVDDQTIDAVSEGMPLEPGQTVRVIEVRGTQAVVRAVDANAADAEPATSGDVLSRPIESLGLEAFDDPLA